MAGIGDGGFDPAGAIMAHGFVEMQHQRPSAARPAWARASRCRVGVFGEGFQAVDIDMGLQVRQFGSGHVAHAHGASQSGIAVGGPADDGVHQLTLFGQPVRLRRQPGAQLGRARHLVQRQQARDAGHR